MDRGGTTEKFVQECHRAFPGNLCSRRIEDAIPIERKKAVFSVIRVTFERRATSSNDGLQAVHIGRRCVGVISNSVVLHWNSDVRCEIEWSAVLDIGGTNWRVI